MRHARSAASWIAPFSSLFAVAAITATASAAPSRGSSTTSAGSSVLAAIAPPASREAPSAKTVSKDDLEALRSELRALRAHVDRAIGKPAAETDHGERRRLEAEVRAEEKKSSSIRSAIKAGLDRAAVQDSLDRVETRLAELRSELAKLPQHQASPTLSLSQVSAALSRLGVLAAPAETTMPPGEASATPTDPTVAPADAGAAPVDPARAPGGTPGPGEIPAPGEATPRATDGSSPTPAPPSAGAAASAAGKSPPAPAAPAKAGAAPDGKQAAPDKASAKPAAKDDEHKVGLLPLEFTAFGDFYYAFLNPGRNEFRIGAVELDASLRLTPFVIVSTAISYVGSADAFGLGAYVIDCGLFGQGEGYPLLSNVVQKSGVSFGRFDVPFGVAYLEYPSVENRLITLPHAVANTHGGWNDLGAQGYALADHWSALAYVVNGVPYQKDGATTQLPKSAAGGRLSGRVEGAFEIGGSTAVEFGEAGLPQVFAGGDLSGTVGPLDLRGEYVLKHMDVAGQPESTHGAYVRAVLDLAPAFLVARYDTTLIGSSLVDRRIASGGGVEIFPKGEIRAVYEQSVDSDERSVLLQLSGGSTFQPTGLRR